MVAPPTIIDWDAVKKLASYHCTVNEIVDFVGCGKSTLYRLAKKQLGMELPDVIEQGRNVGRQNLRKKQADLAYEGDRTMLVWLGKQWLGQTDTMQHNVDVSTIELEIIHTSAKDTREDSD